MTCIIGWQSKEIIRLKTQYVKLKVVKDKSDRLATKAQEKKTLIPKKFKVFVTSWPRSTPFELN